MLFGLTLRASALAGDESHICPFRPASSLKAAAISQLKTRPVCPSRPKLDISWLQPTAGALERAAAARAAQITPIFNSRWLRRRSSGDHISPAGNNECPLTPTLA
jgi:hypothetical protein